MQIFYVFSRYLHVHRTVFLINNSTSKFDSILRKLYLNTVHIFQNEECSEPSPDYTLLTQCIIVFNFSTAS